MYKKHYGYYFILFLVGIYLSIGNLARIFPVPGLSDSVPSTELLVYLSTLIFSVLSGKFFGLINRYRFYYLLIILSAIYGILLNGGIDTVAFAYVIRLILIIFAASVTGYILSVVSGYDIRYVAKYLLIIYSIVIVLGFVIFFVFPNSILLWVFLAQYGVIFSGDPHQNRFLSTYLDPNFYSPISIIPILLSLYMYKVSKSWIYFIFLLIAILSLLLSGSRSGIACFVFIYAYLNFSSFNFRKFTIEKSFFSINMLIVLALPIIAFFSLDTLTVLFDRIAGVKNDGSALGRLASFEDGLSIFEKYPFFGLGYNYLSVKIFALRGVSSVDSSVLATLINFGVIPTLVFCGYFFLQVRKFLKKVSRFNKTGEIDNASVFIIRAFVIYVVICIIFVSQFNNLLYYQYWVFPVIMLSEFFGQCIRRQERKCTAYAPSQSDPSVAS